MSLRSIFTEPTDVDLVTLRNLGPLRPLAGIWEGSGVDEHPVSEGGLDQPHASPDARTFTVRARAGDASTRIISNPFLDEAFRTVEYVLTITVNSDGTFRYEQDTVLMVRERSEPFHHVDRNTLRKVGEPTPNPAAIASEKS